MRNVEGRIEVQVIDDAAPDRTLSSSFMYLLIVYAIQLLEVPLCRAASRRAATTWSSGTTITPKSTIDINTGPAKTTRSTATGRQPAQWTPKA
ncbi:unnamed protein product [Heligmosomoides polygyrus]|uniref:Transposase n=1 Tax=Heligmosomoides polygyrus TaxID=6339 RepID=A0A183FL17_HELPZ|nr:unnamed protein product [Heligmosomoides polygyrus]